jgi:hypothetical protein
MEIAFYIEEYASLTKTQKDLSRGLWKAEIKRRQGDYKEIFFSKKKLAQTAQCCKKTIQRFNKAVKYYLIGVIERRLPNGRKTTNRYEFDPEFFKAMQLMDSKNLLYKDSDSIKKFAESYRQNQNVPYPPEKCPHSYPNSLNPDMSLYGFVHPYLEKIEGMALKDKLFLSRRYSEHAIVAGVEDALWWYRQGNRPETTLTAVIHARIRKHAGC